MTSSYRRNTGGERERLSQEHQEIHIQARPGASSAGPRVVGREEVIHGEAEEIQYARKSEPEVHQATFSTVNDGDPGPSRIPPPRRPSPPLLAVDPNYDHVEHPRIRHSSRRYIVDPVYNFADRPSRRRSPLRYEIDPGSHYAGRPPRPPRPPSPIPVRIHRRNDSPPRYQNVHGRPPRRSGSRDSLPRSPSPERPVRPVPPGFVQPVPLLSRPDRVGGHDLLGLASNPRPKSDPDIQGKVVLCLYHNSRRSYDYRTVEYIHKRGNPIGDRALFHRMRNKYQYELRGWIRRWFSFKGLSTVRLLLYGGGQLFRPKQDDDLFSLIFMKIWWNPNKMLNKNSIKWIRWIEGEKNQHGDFDMAIELIEDYIPERIVLFIGIGLLSIVGITSAWLIKGGDPGYVSTVMSFVLTFIAAVVALTTVWDHFDAGRAKEIKEHTTIVLPDHIKDFSKDPYDELGLWKTDQREPELKDKQKEKE